MHYSECILEFNYPAQTILNDRVQIKVSRRWKETVADFSFGL